MRFETGFAHGAALALLAAAAFGVGLFGFAGNVLAQTSSSSQPTIGLIDSPLWYSKQTLVEGDTVKIYTLVFNGGATAISGTVAFYDKDVVLGRRDFTVAAGATRDVSIDWKVTAGDHLISARILGTTTVVNGKKETVTVPSVQTEPDRQFVAKKIVLPDIAAEVPVVRDEIAGGILEQVEKIEQKISAVLPDRVSEGGGALMARIEEARGSNAEKIDAARAEARQGPDGPFRQAKIFGLNVLSLLLHSRAAFYVTAAVLLFLALRFAWRKIFKRD